ncbi:MAG: helix-turn-helix transcriptional regulator [Thaumarchaeota archaeon]|nr:helix-turn-helix transcriptional regulator [Nitrososphaerota archaeon]
MQRQVEKGKATEAAIELVARHAELGTFLPNVRFAECPIKATLGVLGRKWSMLILRDIGLRRIDRFNRLLESIPGLTPRVLSMRLRDLEEAGYIRCTENKESTIVVRWSLTEMGVDSLPILMRFIAFGSKWHPEEVFDDKKPRTLEELFKPEALRLIEQFA